MYAFMVIGMTGQGKSKFVKDILRNSQLQSFVFDVNNEYEGIATKRDTVLDEKKFIFNCMNNITDTNCIFEEATGFFNGKIPADLRRMIIGKRHRRNNYYFLFHSIADAPPGLVRLCNYVILYKTNDEEPTVRKRYGKLYQPFLRLQNAPLYSKVIIKLIDQ